MRDKHTIEITKKRNAIPARTSDTGLLCHFAGLCCSIYFMGKDRVKNLHVFLLCENDPLNHPVCDPYLTLGCYPGAYG